MIRMKLGALIEAEVALTKLDLLSKEHKLSFKATYKLGRIIKKIQPDLVDYYTEKKKILELVGKEKTELKVVKEGEAPQEVGIGSYDIIDHEKWQKYMKELVGNDIELSNIFPFTVEDLEGITELDTDDFFQLGNFLDQSDTEAEPKERKKISVTFDKVEPVLPEVVPVVPIPEVLPGVLEEVQSEVAE
jgi:hypothetical protein